MSEFIRRSFDEKNNLDLKIDRHKNYNFNHYQQFVKVLENVSIQIQNFYERDSLDLTDFFQSVVTQIHEVLEIDRIEIVQIAFGRGQKSRAKIENQEIKINSSLKLPIKVELREWGYILLESSQTNLILPDNELNFLNQLSLYIAIAIQQKQLKRQWREKILKTKALETNLQDFAFNPDSVLLSCDLLEKLQTNYQISNLQEQKHRLENQNSNFKLLTDLTYKIRNSLNLEEILDTTVSEILHSLKLDRLVIYQVFPGGAGKVLTESLVPGYPSVLGFEFPEETLPLYCQHRFSHQPYKAVINIKEEYQESYPCLVEFLEDWCVKSKVIVPIVYNKNLWGYLIAHQCSYYRQWQQLELELLYKLSNQLAIAIKQSEVYHQLEVELQERKETQNKLQNSLKEKEILIKEIHHRVGNNLNIINSILNLQTSYIKDEKAINMFVDSQSRIRTIALIYEQLCNSTDLSRINFANYIQSLIENFCGVHNTDAKNIHFEINLMSLELKLETAIPCGLLINEIITNSLKYAFPENIFGQIKISFSSDGVLHHLNISDNGIEMPKDLDLDNSTSLSLRLINLLTMQLNGQLKTESSSKGTVFQLTFPELKYNNRI